MPAVVVHEKVGVEESLFVFPVAHGVIVAFRFRFADTQHYLLIPPPTLIDRWPSGWTDDEIGLSVGLGGLSCSETPRLSAGLRGLSWSETPRLSVKVSVGLRQRGSQLVWEVSVVLRHRVSQLV